MDQPDIAIPTCRHDGWTPERLTLFLEHLAATGNVRTACARVGMSREGAYRLRRRDPAVARAWATALLLAREVAADALAERAIDGVEEEVWHRGELVGTKRRYDSRLLLAHLARLDKMAEQQGPSRDVERFDELLACIAGEPVPEALEVDDDALPLDRDEQIDRAERWVVATWTPPGDEDDEDAFDAEIERARLEAAAQWDEWHARACAAVDALMAADCSSRTLSTVCTSALEAGPLSSAPAGSRTR